MDVHRSQWKSLCSVPGSAVEDAAYEIVPLQNETARLQELYRYQVLDTDPDPALDELAMFAAEVCQTPIALISFVDFDRQWFKSKIGLAISETPRYISFCTHAIQQPELFIVTDALSDERFRHSPLVLEDPNLRFYAGAPLITSAGFILGTLCVADVYPRCLSQQQLNQLQILSRQVMAQLELKQQHNLAAKTKPLQGLQPPENKRDVLSQQELFLFNLANQIRNSLDLDTILQTAVDEIHRLLQVDYCHFLWCLPDGDGFNLAMTHEAKRSHLPTLNSNFDHSSTGITKHISNLQLLKVDDTSTACLPSETQELLIRQGIRSELLFPLKTYSGQLGAIVCSYSSCSHTWTEQEIQILQAVTNHLAIALDQAELFAETRATALAAQTQAQYLAEALQKLQQTQAQLIQHEKMSSLGQLVAGVAHEINNPVTFISGNISYASEYIHDLLKILELYQQYYPEPEQPIQELSKSIDLEFIASDLPRLVSSMKIGVDRIYQIVLSLRNFSRLDEAEMKPVNIHEGLENTLLILQNRLKRNTVGAMINVVRDYQELPLVECSAGQLNQVFMNLLSNAIDALDTVSKNPTITISTELVTCPPVHLSSQSETEDKSAIDHVKIRFRDNGCGMTESVIQKVFNPFFTTKPVGKGTGLGLSISYQIIAEKHHGSLICESQPDQGTEFIIQIPVKSRDMKS